MRARTLLFVAVAVVALVPGWSGYERLALLGPDARITAARVPLDPADPSRRRLGSLTYMGGVKLRSPDPAFGGFSALHVDGDRVTLLSDGGNIVRFQLKRDGQVAEPAFAELPGGPGTGWRKLDRDSEGMAVDPKTRTAWIVFERANAIWRYGPGLLRPEASVRPAAMRRWRSNLGAETLVRRRDGSFLVFQESAGGSVLRDVLGWRGDPTGGREPDARFRYRPPAGFDPVDATELPDGRLLVLSRSYRLPLRFAAVLEVIDRSALRHGAVVRGRPIARLGAPLTHDNMEGVTATVERGRTIIWLVSDDNRNLLERTLLLKFRLD
jgi:hypothetical protein